MKTKRIQKGEKVRIKNPEFFVRCGYPLTPNLETVDKTTQCIDEDIDKFLTQCKIKLGIEKPLNVDLSLTRSGGTNKTNRSIDRIKDVMKKELTYLYCLVNHFGGNERRIHTRTDPNMKGKFFMVEGYKACYTGNRVSGYTSGYFGSQEYEPPYLGGMEYHHILKLSKCERNLACQPFYIAFDKSNSQYMIEDVHVERVWTKPILENWNEFSKVLNDMGKGKISVRALPQNIDFRQGKYRREWQSDNLLTEYLTEQMGKENLELALDKFNNVEQEVEA